MSFASLFTIPKLSEVEAKIIALAQYVEIQITNFEPGSAAERLFFAVSFGAFAYIKPAYIAARSGFLAYATDPGDPDPDDPTNASQTPAPGWLSEKGANDYATVRRGRTFATGFETLTDASVGGGTYVLKPFALTFQNLVTGKTYRNADDPTIYVGGSYTLTPGTAVTIPIIADEAGVASNANAGDISILSSSLPGVTVTNASAALGSERETIEAYRARCLTEMAATSPGGPGDAYRRLATTAIDGTPLLQADGVTPVGITRVHVSKDSATGIVNAYFADVDGPAISDDVTAANANIEAYGVPDCITFTGLAAIATTVAVTWVVKFKASPGVDSTVVHAAVVAALNAHFAIVPIGGEDQTAGAGTLYLSEIQDVIGSAHPAIYKRTTSAPAGDVALALGHVAVAGAYSGTETAG